MAQLAIITPSYGPDAELCGDLNASISRTSPAGTVHEIIVPRQHRSMFKELEGPRCRIRTVGEFLPRSMVDISGANVWLNLRRPLPPVRGWIAQQLVKLSAAAEATSDVALLVDSDVVFIRRFSASTYMHDNGVRFYRIRDAIHSEMVRHIRWHQVARQLLGLPGDIHLPLTDYVCCPMAWDPRIVRHMLAHVEQVTGRPWTSAIASRLHFSEAILYGVFVDEVLGIEHGSTSMLCHNYYDEEPLDDVTAGQFVAGLGDSDIAVMISAKSGTPLATRRAALAALPHRP